MAKTVTVTIEMTFVTDQCEDVDSENYDPMEDVADIMGFGVDWYNLEDWKEVK